MTDFWVVGIDPGKDGAVVVMRSHGSIAAQALAPTLKGKGSKEIFNVRGMMQLLKPWANEPRVYVCLEKAQAMPGQGVTSMWTTGYGYGLWEGLLEGMGFAYETPRPQDWQKVMYQGVPGDGKDRSINAAQRLFKDLELRPGRCTTDQDGLADAALLAEYMRRRVGGK